MACSRARQVDHRGNLHQLGRSHRYAAEHGEHLSFSSNLLEHLMPRSLESLKAVARPHNVANCELTTELCGKGRGEESPNANSPPRAVSPIDRSFAALLSSFMEGFALFAMAHCYPAEAKSEQPEDISVADISIAKGSRSLTLVSSTHPEVTRSASESAPGRPHTGPSADVGLAEIYDTRSFDADRSNWLARSWSIAVERWQHWRYEREITKAVATLEELDDRTLRDIGIPDRSEIEQAARYGRKWALD